VTLRTRLIAIVAGIVAVGIAFRLAVVLSWHVPGGDGIQYHQLSQSLVRDGRYALGPPPKPLSFARLPGYPLFLAYVAVRQAPLDVERHLVRAAVANVLLDAGLALVVFFTLRRWSERAALVGLAAVFLCPLFMLLACYGLTETFATFLTAAAVALALDTWRGGRLWPRALLLGAVLGYAQLTRNDNVLVLPAVGLALLWAPQPLKQRLLAIGLVAVVGLAVFAPWPIRNLRAFGKMYASGSLWRTNDGRELPLEILEWNRTWATSARGESYIDVPIVMDAPLDPRRPGVLMPQMVDSDEERARVAALFERYNRERWSPAVREEFARLARDRRRAHPFRTYVLLPLGRLWHLVTPPFEWELPFRVKWLPIPRPAFGVFDVLAWAFAIAGAVALGRRGRPSTERRLVVICALWILGRFALFSFAVPNATTQRYFVEAYPALILLGALGTVRVAAWVCARAVRVYDSPHVDLREGKARRRWCP
jgi:4-amino-4-deoxy-L-arabinose transferase-like glycosyltransferase